MQASWQPPQPHCKPGKHASRCSPPLNLRSVLSLACSLHTGHAKGLLTMRALLCGAVVAASPLRQRVLLLLLLLLLLVLLVLLLWL